RIGSFASTHAAASFAVAAVFADRFERPVGWLAYSVAGAVAASRVYTKEHFASDVVAGGLIGWGLGKFLASRHATEDSRWQIRPLALSDRGGGLMLDCRF